MQPGIFQSRWGRWREGGGGGGVELRNFDKHFGKNTRKTGPTGKQFGNFSPTYPQNYILNGKFNPKMNTIRTFLSKIRTPFSISKMAGEISPFLP